MGELIKAKVVAKHRHADVDFDMFSTCKWLTDEGQRRLLGVFNQCRDRMVQAGESPKKVGLHFGHCSGTLRDVPKAEADAIREEVEAILNDPSCVYIPEHLQKDPDMMKRIRTRDCES